MRGPVEDAANEAAQNDSSATYGDDRDDSNTEK